eukprot:UC1_evm1s2095
MGNRAIFVDTGVKPVGSTWARNPIPRINDNNAGLANPGDCPGPSARSCPGGYCPDCLQFPAPCPWDNGIFNCTGPSCDGNGQGECSNDWVTGLIYDTVKIPKNLPPGDYVLGWRWDCEETAQIWSNCADVVLTAAREP